MSRGVDNINNRKMIFVFKIQNIFNLNKGLGVSTNELAGYKDSIFPIAQSPAAYLHKRTKGHIDEAAKKAAQRIVQFLFG